MAEETTTEEDGDPVVADETTTPIADGETTTIGNTSTGSDGLPDAPAENTPGAASEEFTTSAATTPMDADPFVSALDEQIRQKDITTGWVTNTFADEQRVEISYIASEDNQRERLEAFAESFVEVVARTGGTGGWTLDMIVQTGAERNVWYTWTVRNELAVQRLSGELSREEFYAEIEATTMTPTATSS